MEQHNSKKNVVQGHDEEPMDKNEAYNKPTQDRVRQHPNSPIAGVSREISFVLTFMK